MLKRAIGYVIVAISAKVMSFSEQTHQYVLVCSMVNLASGSVKQKTEATDVRVRDALRRRNTISYRFGETKIETGKPAGPVRSTKSETNSKFKFQKTSLIGEPFGHLNFRLVSDFGFRASDLAETIR